MTAVADFSDLHPEAVLRAGVVVVGSGVAGAEVATLLARRGHDVLVVESGRADFDAEIQALNDLEFLGKRHRAIDPDAPYHRYLPPDLRGVSRVRQLGGTSSVWTGKWKWFQEGDFIGRGWVPDSAWPIRLADLTEHYRAVAQDYGLGDLEAEARRPELRALSDRLARHDLKFTSFYWERTPLRTGPRLAEEAKRNPTLRILTGATVTSLDLGPDRRTVIGVRCAGETGRRVTVAGRLVVLATGGIETPRILLASDGQVPGGIGNAGDLVGRFYADHLKHHTADMVPGPLSRELAPELRYGPKPRFCLCFALSDALQRDRRVLEHVIYLKPRYETRKQSLGRIIRFGRPIKDGRGRVRSWRIKLVTEQVPNRDSRVVLSDERDRLGMRKAALDWRLTEHDTRSLAEVVALSTKRFAEAGIGRLCFDRDPPSLETMTDAAHQMGTTRMASDPSKGVVDLNARVFGTENLYVAGSAVFPTCPSYSPTFTILALARRLALHLHETVRGSRPQVLR